jgi:hypothetical protein
MLTDEELKGISAQALNMAKLDIERNQFNFLFAAYFADDTPPLHRMEKIEALVVKQLGQEWLNCGATKDIGFGVLRMAMRMLPPEAVVIVTAVNAFVPTEKFQSLPVKQQRKLMRETHEAHHAAAREGLLDLRDALVAIAQTPERVCQYMQTYGPGSIPLGTASASFFPQKDFGGRLKMYFPVRHA